MTEQVPLIYQAMKQLFEELEWLKPDAVHKAFKHEYRTIKYITTELGKATRKAGLISRTVVLDTKVNCHVIGDKLWTSICLIMQYTFTHPEDGSEYSIQGVGSSTDSGNNAAASAQSMAKKYALDQALNAAFDDIVDADHEEQRLAVRASKESSARVLLDLAKSLKDLEFVRNVYKAASEKNLLGEYLEGQQLSKHLSGIAQGITETQVLKAKETTPLEVVAA